MRAAAAALVMALTGSPSGALTAVEAAMAADAALGAAAARLDAAEGPDASADALNEAAAAIERGLAAMREGLRRAEVREAFLEDQAAQAERARLRRLIAMRAARMAPASAWGARPEGALTAARAALAREVGADVADRLEAAPGRRLDEARRRRARQAAARAALRGALASVQAARADLASGDGGGAPAAELVSAGAALAEFVDAAGGPPPARTPPIRPTAPGALPPPVASAEPVSRFGEPDEIGQPVPGLRLSAPADALVRAPVVATVRFAGPLTGFGGALILELGPGRLLTLAGLGALSVAAGETVRAGAVLGQLGVRVGGAAEFPVEAPVSEGAGSSAILYVEAREDGTPVDPRSWFAFQGKAGSP